MTHTETFCSCGLLTPGLPRKNSARPQREQVAARVTGRRRLSRSLKATIKGRLPSPSAWKSCSHVRRFQISASSEQMAEEDAADKAHARSTNTITVQGSVRNTTHTYGAPPTSGIGVSLRSNPGLGLLMEWGPFDAG